MRRYAVKPGESPTMIARGHGISLESLVRANPHKQTTRVAGQLTFKDIRRSEILNVPIGLGDSVSDAINAVIAAGGPCLQQNVALVCAAQALLGVTVDGKWGSATSSAARMHVASAPAACYPRPTWWAPIGQSSCPTIVTPAPAPTVAPTLTPTAQALAPASVLLLGTINPCDQSSVQVVCGAQRALGVTVDGKYGLATATAAYKVFPGAPPACSPRPTWWAPVGQSNCGITAVTTAPTTTQPLPVPAPAPTAAAIPTAVLALATINPCLQQNVAIVYAAQKALGVAQDGKYGTATASAAQRILPSAPAACSPRPTWWAPVGQVNPIPSTALPAPTAVSLPTTTAALPMPTAPTAVTVPTTTAPTAPTTEVVTAPTAPKKLSTGAIVAGTVGAAALVGLIALAATHKPTRQRARKAARRAHRAVRRAVRKRRRR